MQQLSLSAFRCVPTVLIACFRWLRKAVCDRTDTDEEFEKVKTDMDEDGKTLPFTILSLSFRHCLSLSFHCPFTVLSTLSFTGFP